MQVFVTLDGSGMIAICPERSLLTLASIVLLGGAAGDELHALCDYTCTGVFNQEMNMSGGDCGNRVRKGQSVSSPRTSNAGNGDGRGIDVLRVLFSSFKKPPQAFKTCLLRRLPLRNQEVLLVRPSTSFHSTTTLPPSASTPMRCSLHSV